MNRKIESILSSHMQHLSSRLARLAVEEKLCHSFQAFHSSYSDTGLLGIYFVTDRNSIEDMMHWSQNAWSVLNQGLTHTENTSTVLRCFTFIIEHCIYLVSFLHFLQDEPVHHSDRE